MEGLEWLDQGTASGEEHEGGRWHVLRAGEIPVVVLARGGAAIPHAGLVQSTGQIYWGEIVLVAYGGGPFAQGLYCHPDDGRLWPLRLWREAGGFALRENPSQGRAGWKIRAVP